MDFYTLRRTGMRDQQQKLFRALFDIGQELAELTDPDIILKRLLEISREVFQFENAIIRLLDESGTQLETVASYGYPAAVTSQSIPLGQGIMGKAARFARPYLVHNLLDSADYLPGIEAACSELAVPLIARGRVIGVFNVESPHQASFTAEDSDALSILAGQAAIAIDNARLYRDLCQASREKDKLHHLNEQILASVSIGLYTIDRQMRITSWNHSMARMSGIDAAHALHHPLLELFPSLEEEDIAARLRRVLSTGQPENLRLLHRGRAGVKRLQKRCLAPLLEDGSTTGVVVVVEDITEFEQLLAQTIQSEKLAEVGRMSAGIAHEINNPLAIISAACMVMLNTQEPPSKEQVELLEQIDGEVDRLKELTEGLLSYSSTPEGKRTATRLEQTLRDVIKLLGYELSKKQIELRQELNEIPALLVDRNKFKQVFLNLILNAVQAMEANGHLTIVSELHGSGEVRIHIKDSGPGIPDKLKEQIFEPFFSDRRDGTGTGLGLYLCRKIITDHGGQLTVSDNPGSGSCFTIELPSTLQEP
jgi:PAS domain S-box-containing protein